MAKQFSYQGISKRAKALLSSGEDKSVDYKEKVKGLHAEDLVAFANSANGGAILIGVRETAQSNGMQKGEPLGHLIDDDTRLQIMGKALSCNPPIQIEIYVENLDHLPFYRIEIPSGLHKPYSTNSGTYKIREDGRNNPLHPEPLLKMFLERESEEFRHRFSEATNKLESRMTEALASVNNLEQVISTKIEDIGSSLGWAEYKAGDAADTIETVKAQVTSLASENRKQTQRLRAIARKVDANDPIRQKMEKEVADYLLEKFKENPKVLEAVKNGGALSVSLNGDAADELDQDDLNRLLVEAVKKVTGKSDVP
ncbi:MAG: ATP-binding protein [Gallionella sp.]|nr:ATP-binding protein [Gallionella sp.]